eukprot:Hpha_TRINITY_DN2005_c0_g1::TRINITY_DN2005_c0_g1_i1::g.82953::m.82953
MSSSRVAVVTGATGVFGRHIADGLVAAGYETVCVCRDKERGSVLVEKLLKDHPGGSARMALVDCGSRESIRQFAAQWTGPLHILVNNAAVTPSERRETSEGIEQQWAVNVLGYYWFVKHLERHFTGDVRVCLVASFYAGGLDLQDPEFKRREYDVDSAYRASKQANRMMASALARLWQSRKGTPAAGWTITSAHPGVATSGVSLGLGFDLDRSESAAKKGAETPLHCVVAPGVSSAGYFSGCKQQGCEFSRGTEACDKLLALLATYDA